MGLRPTSSLAKVQPSVLPQIDFVRYMQEFVCRDIPRLVKMSDIGTFTEYKSIDIHIYSYRSIIHTIVCPCEGVVWGKTKLSTNKTQNFLDIPHHPYSFVGGVESGGKQFI